MYVCAFADRGRNTVVGFARSLSFGRQSMGWKFLLLYIAADVGPLVLHEGVDAFTPSVTHARSCYNILCCFSLFVLSPFSGRHCCARLATLCYIYTYTTPSRHEWQHIKHDAPNATSGELRRGGGHDGEHGHRKPPSVSLRPRALAARHQEQGM